MSDLSGNIWHMLSMRPLYLNLNNFAEAYKKALKEYFICFNLLGLPSKEIITNMLDHK